MYSIFSEPVSLVGPFKEHIKNMSPFIVTQGVLHKFKSNSIKISNTVFRLHYSATFIILVACSLAFQVAWGFGDIIDCISDSRGRNEDLDEYCKISGTYTVLPACHLKGTGAHPYIHTTNGNDQKRYHNLYQWMGLIFFIQAALFYAPHHLWKQLEDGHMKQIVGELNEPVIDNSTKRNQVQGLVAYLQGNLGYYQTYFWGCFTCEILNLVNVLFQIYIQATLFGLQDLGPALVRYWLTTNSTVESAAERSSFLVKSSPETSPEKQAVCTEDVSPIELYFPTVTKCDFQKVGPSGNIQRDDLLCVLWLNVVYQQLYTFLWFWFCFILIATAVHILYRITIISVPFIRGILLKSRYPSVNRDFLLTFAYKRNIGDWFVMYQLSKNLPTEISADVFQGIGSEVLEK